MAGPPSPDGIVRPPMRREESALDRSARPGALSRLLRVPLFYKVLVANSLIVVLGAVFGTWITAQRARSDPSIALPELVALFASLGLAISVALNYLVLKATFQPLEELERTADRVRQGDLDARPKPAIFSDPHIDKLRETFTATLDTIAEYRQQLQALSSQVIRAQEDERKRIARELHDETAQMLTSLLLRLRVIERESNPAELRRGLADLRNLVGDALEAVRDLALELRPPALDELGLIPALHWQIKQFGERSNVRTEFSATGLDDGERLPPELELVLYRVVQEALTNVAKHARATSVSVRIERTGDRVTATVRDDGRGFAVGEVLDSRERGLGLFGMQERAALVGGVLRIESEPGRGTQVSIAAPIRTPPLAKPDLEPELVR